MVSFDFEKFFVEFARLVSCELLLLFMPFADLWTSWTSLFALGISLSHATSDLSTSAFQLACLQYP